MTGAPTGRPRGPLFPHPTERTTPMRPIPLLTFAAALAAAVPAAAQSPGFRLDECGSMAREFFGDYEARADMRDQGVRTDGTFAIGGDIFLETRKAYVSCSFAPDGITMTEFYVDGQDETAFAQGGSPGGEGPVDGVGYDDARPTVTGDVRVQFAPGTSGARYGNRLGSGDAVTYILNARNGQFLTVDLVGDTEFLDYIISVPSGDILDQASQSSFRYYGQLYQSGDHRVEVFYNGDQGTFADFDIDFVIE